MSRTGMRAAVGFCLLLFGSELLAEPDLAREQRMRAEIEDAILDGEPIDLTTPAGRGFLGILTEGVSDGAAKGTVIVLHGRGFHPDWVDVVQPLRIGLTEHGWHTLAIQLPVLEKSAKYYDYVPLFPAAAARIDAAIKEAYRVSPDGKIVLIAHSCGAHMANHWIHAREASAVAQLDAFVGIGMGATDLGQQMVEPFAFDRIGVPVLDIYGQSDFPAVKRMAPARLAAIEKMGQTHSEQRAIVDAEHYFVDRGDALVEAVAAWLKDL